MEIEPKIIFKLCQELESIEQDEGDLVLAPIAYSEEYKTAMGYCRTLMKLNELSERSLMLTQYIIHSNPAHYSIWEYRRQILKSLGSSLVDELELLNNLMEENPKNYQLW